MSAGTPYQIVVGVDGSDNSEHALRLAFEEKQLRDGILTAVFAWEYPLIGVPNAFDLDDLEAEAKQFLLAEIAAVLGEGSGVQAVIAQGDPSATLLAACDRLDANLLVIGARGREGFTGLLLGSVGQQCAVHSPCPVLIVKPTPATSGPEDAFAAGV
jgi:nucleotide-binding universal stress UspA family protein